MAKDNGLDVDRQYYDAMQAQLGERVTNLNRRQTDLENEMRSGFRQIEQSIAGIATETRAAIAGLSQDLAERNRPQWQALSVMLATVIAIGGLAYWPIRDATGELKVTTARLGEAMITRQEMEWRQARSQEDRLRLEGSVSDIRSNLVPRAELDRVFDSFADQFRDKQRQLDEIKASQAGIYGARDAMMDMRQRLDRLERGSLSPH